MAEFHTIIKHLVQLSILTIKKRTCTKGGVWVYSSTNFLEKLPNVSDKQVSQKRQWKVYKLLGIGAGELLLNLLHL